MLNPRSSRHHSLIFWTSRLFIK